MDKPIYHFGGYCCCRAALSIDERLCVDIFHIMYSIFFMIMYCTISAIRRDRKLTFSMTVFSITILNYRYAPRGEDFIAVVTHINLSVRRTVCQYGAIVAARQPCPKLLLLSAFCADDRRAVGPAGVRCRAITRRRSLTAAGGQHSGLPSYAVEPGMRFSRLSTR